MVPLHSIPVGYWLGMAGWIAFGVVSLVVALKLRRRWRGNPRRVGWTSFALGCWFLASTLTMVEMAFALFVDRTDSFSKTNISRRWFDLHVRKNAEGYRDERDLKQPLQPGQRRIVFVGDSFTFGHGVEVEQRFSDLVAHSLESEQPGAFVVANVSRPGNDARNVVETVDQLLSEGTRIDVLIYTFVPNDIEGFDERTAEFYQSLASADPQFFLFRDTYFFNLMWYRWQALTRPESRDYYSYLKESYDGPPWDRLERTLEGLVDTCRSRKIELHVVLFPFLQSLGPDYPFTRGHQRLSEFFASKDVDCIDLRLLLEPAAKDGLTVNASDAHPNPRAHAIAAEAILKALKAGRFEARGGVTTEEK